MQRCVECGIRLTSVEMLASRLCSVTCGTYRYRRTQLEKDRLEIQSFKSRNKKPKKKELVRLDQKVSASNLQRQKMLQRLANRDLSDPFFQRQDWRSLRYQALKVYGRICALCRTTDGKMHVDHIKPRSLFPELALEFKNLQILCEACNLGKSNRDSTDFRTTQPASG